MNAADIIVIAVLCAALAAAVLVTIKNKRKGKNGCGGDCSSCGGCKMKEHTRTK